MTNNKIVDFNTYKVKSVQKPKRGAEKPMSITDVDNWVEENIQKLMKATNLEHSEAIKMATDFYRQYPALMEMVRSTI